MKYKVPAPGSTGSLTCGILSIVLAVLPVVGLTLGIVAIYLAKHAMKEYKEMSNYYYLTSSRTAGFVLGVIGTVLGSVSTALLMYGFIGGLVITGRPFDM